MVSPQDIERIASVFLLALGRARRKLVESRNGRKVKPVPFMFVFVRIPFVLPSPFIRDLKQLGRERRRRRLLNF